VEHYLSMNVLSLARVLNLPQPWIFYLFNPIVTLGQVGGSTPRELLLRGLFFLQYRMIVRFGASFQRLLRLSWFRPRDEPGGCSWEVSAGVGGEGLDRVLDFLARSFFAKDNDNAAISCFSWLLPVNLSHRYKWSFLGPLGPYPLRKKSRRDPIL
jgi:hypothetical protein